MTTIPMEASGKSTTLHGDISHITRQSHSHGLVKATYEIANIKHRGTKTKSENQRITLRRTLGILVGRSRGDVASRLEADIPHMMEELDPDGWTGIGT